MGAMVILAVAMVSRCSFGPPKPGVEAELQKLKIPTIPKTLTPAQKADLEKAWDGPGQFFVRRGCIGCHAISVYDVKGFTPLGPDLSIAVEDVQKRFGRNLEQFLAEPQGTMQMVLGQLIVLTPEDKTEALKQLNAAYAKHKEKQTGTK